MLRPTSHDAHEPVPLRTASPEEAEEDLGRIAWRDVHDEADANGSRGGRMYMNGNARPDERNTRKRSAKSKGKQRQVVIASHEEDGEDGDAFGDVDTNSSAGLSLSPVPENDGGRERGSSSLDYPPMNEDEEESKRIAEVRIFSKQTLHCSDQLTEHRVVLLEPQTLGDGRATTEKGCSGVNCQRAWVQQCARGRHPPCKSPMA